MKDLRRIGNRYEFQLENRQIILIVFGLLLVLTLSFLMGSLFGLNLDRMSGEPQVAAAALPSPADAPVPAPAPLPAASVDVENLSPMAEPILGAVSSREDLIRQLEGEKVPASANASAAPPSPAPAAPAVVEPKVETVPPAPNLASPAPAPETKPQAKPEDKPAVKEAAPKTQAKPTKSEAASIDEMTIAKASRNEGAMPAPGRAPAKAETRPAYSGNGTYTIQIASVPTRDEAQAMVDELRAKRYDAYFVQVSIPEKGTFYRVRIGHYRDLDQAKKALIIIQQREGKYFDAWITQ